MKENFSVMVCCANGAGSSLMLKQTMQKVLDKNGLKPGKVHHCALSEGKSAAAQYDVVLCAQNFANMYGEIPCLRCLTAEEMEAYETNTGLLIANYFRLRDYEAVPAALCKNHGPFSWGKDAAEAVHNAVVLEEVAKMAARCELINARVLPAPQELQDKHYYRKHGANAYYGQNVGRTA